MRFGGSPLQTENRHVSGGISDYLGFFESSIYFYLNTLRHAFA